MSPTGHFTQQQVQRLDLGVAKLEALDAEQRALDARRLVVLNEIRETALGSHSAHGSELAHRALRLEVATALKQSEHTAERSLSLAYQASEQYPASLHTLATGEVSLPHLRVIADAGTILTTGDPEVDAQRRESYEAEALRYAREETPNRLRPIAQRLAAAHAQATLTERHEEAAPRRSVRVVDADDGMADLIAYLPAPEAYAIRDRLGRIARSISNAGGANERAAQGAGGTESGGTGSAGTAAHAPGTSRDSGPAPRSRDAIRADVLCDLLLGRAPQGGGAVRAQIQVLVPGAVLAEKAVAGGASSADVCELVGYGPIDSRSATDIAAGAETWEQITAAPTGEVIRVDRYRPTPRMRRVLAARDIHCRAPGCRAPVSRCDTDHTVAAADGGPTSTDNLAHLCRSHHTVKHHTDWTVTQDDGGVMTWASPTGRIHTDRPPSRVRFEAPPRAPRSQPQGQAPPPF